MHCLCVGCVRQASSLGSLTLTLSDSCQGCESSTGASCFHSCSDCSVLAGAAVVRPRHTTCDLFMLSMQAQQLIPGRVTCFTCSTGWHDMCMWEGWAAGCCPQWAVQGWWRVGGSGCVMHTAKVRHGVCCDLSGEAVRAGLKPLGWEVYRGGHAFPSQPTSFCAVHCPLCLVRWCHAIGFTAVCTAFASVGKRV